MTWRGRPRPQLSAGRPDRLLKKQCPQGGEAQNLRILIFNDLQKASFSSEDVLSASIGFFIRVIDRVGVV
jgi:hypothetical protein